MKLKYLLCLFFVLILSIGVVSADENATDFKGSFTDLNADIDNATDDGVIDLNRNYIRQYGDDSIQINKNLTINGNGAIIDGNRNSIMQINANANLNGIVFQNSYGPDYGALKGSCNRLVINNCTFINNLAADGACVINVDCSCLVINNSRFIHNGVGSSWWIFDLKNCNLTIENSEFTENARSIRLNDCRVTVSNSSFSNNYFDFWSYGVFYSQNSDFTVVESDFISNSAQEGGAIYAVNTNLQVESCRFVNNFAQAGGVLKGDSKKLTVRKSIFENNTHSIDWKCSDFVVDESIFHANIGFIQDATLNVVSNQTLINNSNFNYNNGTIICCKNVIKICNSNFTNNVAYCQEIIYLYQSDAQIHNTIFSNNRAYGDHDSVVVHLFENKLSIANSKFIKNSKRTIRVDSDAASFTVINCEFTENDETIDCYSKTARITNTKFSKNRDDVCFLSQDCRKYVVDRCNFTQNTGGCPLSALGDAGTITNCKFIKNNNSGVGALLMGGAKSKLSNCLFEQNYGRDNGAVVLPETGSISNCVFKNNHAVKADGALTCNIKIASTNKFTGNTPAKLELIGVFPKKVEYMSGTRVKFVVIEKYSKKRIPGVKITVYRDGINSRYYHLKTNSNGIASLDVSTFTASPAVGEYIVTYPKKYTLEKSGSFFDDTQTFRVELASAKTIVKAPKVVNKKYFKVTVKHKTTKKPVKKLKLRIRVFTGKKYVKFAAFTNKNGVALLKTAGISPGNHKVVITSENGLYIVKAKSSIRIY